MTPNKPSEMSGDCGKTFRTVADCEKQHEETFRQHRDNRKRVWWLAGILVGLSALMFTAIGQGWSAINRADSVERHIQRVDEKIETQGTYLERTLNEMRIDIREIRASQERALQANPNK